jgi:hypothetical protein
MMKMLTSIFLQLVCLISGCFFATWSSEARNSNCEFLMRVLVRFEVRSHGSTDDGWKYPKSRSSSLTGQNLLQFILGLGRSFFLLFCYGS